VATRFNRTKEAKDCVQQTRYAFLREMLQTVVRVSARLGEAFSYARTIVEHDPDGMGATGLRRPGRRAGRTEATTGGRRGE
jgi:hypothetical protein